MDSGCCDQKYNEKIIRNYSQRDLPVDEDRAHNSDLKRY